MTDLQTAINTTNNEALFKTDFKKYAEVTYNKDMFLWTQIAKPEMTGKKAEISAPFGYIGGVGSGSLSDIETRHSLDKTATITRKKVYAKALVDRDSAAAAKSEKGAFVQFMKHPLMKVAEGFQWNMNRIMWGTGDGKLGTIASGGVTDNGGGNYTLVISNMNVANFEEQMLVNIETGNTEKFVIEEVDPTATTITVQRQTGGSQVPAATDEIFLQTSEDNDPMGVKGVCDATSGSLYGIPVSRRWQAYRLNAGSAAISTDILTNAMLAIEAKVGRSGAPNVIVLSYTQMANLLNVLEDKKVYQHTTVSPRDKSLKGIIGFPAIEVAMASGNVKIVSERFVEPDRAYLLNTNQIKAYTYPMSGFVDYGSGNYLHHYQDDQFEIRYCWYGEIYVAPTYQGVIYGLAT